MIAPRDWSSKRWLISKPSRWEQLREALIVLCVVVFTAVCLLAPTVMK